MKRLLLLNGPNINLLGNRENNIYGSSTLANIEADLKKFVENYGCEVECYQSNHEGELIDWLHNANSKFYGIIFNPAGYTHTSVALHDAIKAIDVPVVEVHISNIYSREEFRHTSIIAPVSKGQITGFGVDGYKLAALALINDTI